MSWLLKGINTLQIREISCNVCFGLYIACPCQLTSPVLPTSPSLLQYIVGNALSLERLVIIKRILAKISKNVSLIRTELL